MKTKIKTFVIEEHHEAFLVWMYAVSNKLIFNHGNLLLHIDEHSDMSNPVMKKSIKSVLNDNLAEISNFCQTELGIASFVLAGSYVGLFDEVYWIKQEHRKKENPLETLCVRSYNQESKRLIMFKYQDNLPIDPDCVTFLYQKLHENQIPPIQKPVILDIDLDYFSCCDNPIMNTPLTIQITKDEYDKSAGDKYNKFKLLNHSRIDYETNGEKYLMLVNNFEDATPSPSRVPEEEILKRIKRLIVTLETANIKPAIIDICRSRISGYTPSDQYEFIEKHLIKELQTIYDIEIERDVTFNSI